MNHHGDRPSGPEPAHIPLDSERDSVAAILDVIRRGERFLVCSHSRPDGDAVGSMLATGMRDGGDSNAE